MNLGIVAAFGYGILALLGGIIGYIQAKSKVSLISGIISGLFIIFDAYVSILIMYLVDMQSAVSVKIKVSE